MPASPLCVRRMRQLKSCRTRMGIAAQVALAALLSATNGHARERLLVGVAIKGGFEEGTGPAWSHVADLEGAVTEVAVASTAPQSDCELVGVRELRSGLASGLLKGGLGACISEPSCLASLGDAAGARRALLGEMTIDGAGIALRFKLVDTRTAAAQRTWMGRSSGNDLHALAVAFDEGIRALLASGRTQVVDSAPAAIRKAPTESSPKPALSFNGDRPRAAPGRGSASATALLPVAGYSLGALAVISFSAAAVSGGFGEATPSGRTRAETQMDLEERKSYARTANTLFLVGSALAILGLGTLVLHGRVRSDNR